ncbi:MAG: PAS domain S-box protein [Alphaproteobacteria bacterium]
MRQGEQQPSRPASIADDEDLRQLADALPQIVCAVGNDGKIAYINRAFYDYLGGPGCGDANEDWFGAKHPDDRPRCVALWLQAQETGRDYAAESRFRRADGVYRWHFITAKPVRDAAGRLLRWYGAAIDIDDRKRAEVQLGRTAEKLTATLESISDGFYMLDRQWRFSFLNRQAQRFLRRDRADLIGKNVWEEFPEARDSSLHDEYRRAIESGVAQNFELYYSPLETWFEINAYPSAEGLAVYFRDVTERRTNRETLRQQGALLDQARDAIIVRSLDNRILYWNKGAERMYGWRAEEALGQRIDELLYDDARPFQAARAHVLAHGEWGGQIRQKRRDGRPMTVEGHWTLVRDDAGEPRSILAINTDITEKLMVAEQFEQAQRLESVGQLTGGVAHDFNNLLTVILGNTELLLETLPAESRLRMLTEMTRTAAIRGAELTHRLLAFARRQALQPKPTDVDRLLRDMDALLRRTLREDIDIEMSLAGGGWQAMIDPGQIESAVLNLCINARDAMPKGGRLTIETAPARLDDDYAAANPSAAPGDYVMVAISDTGVGIAPENIDRVFDPFFTTKEFGKGTGLGLSMVYGFIKQSNGHVKIYSELGQGTTIKMYLPRAVDEPASADAPSAEGAATPGGHERLLVVEDDALVRQSAETMLRGLGYDVTAVANGPAALDALRERPGFDLLFTDIVMPGGMNGRQLADRALEMLPGLKVLFTSGYTENAIVHHGRLDAGLRFLGKPYRRQELARKIREALDNG